MKSRELTKRVVLSTLVAAMLVMQIGCSEAPAEPVEEVVAVQPEIVVETTQEFSSNVGDKYQFITMGKNTPKEEYLAGLTLQEDSVLGITGHKVYKDEAGEDFIISGVVPVPVKNIITETLYEEETGNKIIVAAPCKLEGLEKTLSNLQMVNKVFDEGKTEGINDKGRVINVVIDNNSYLLNNLMEQAPDGKWAIAVNMIAKANGMKDEDKTYNRNGDKYYGIPTSVVPGIEGQVDIPSTIDKYELIFDEATGDVYYSCRADMLKKGYYVHEDFLRNKVGWEVKYFEKEDLLVIRTDKEVFKNALVYDTVDLAADLKVVKLGETKEPQGIEALDGIVTKIKDTKKPVAGIPVENQEEKIVDMAGEPTPKPEVKPEYKPKPVPEVKPEPEVKPDAPSTPGYPPTGTNLGSSNNEILENITEGVVTDRDGNVLPEGSEVPARGYIMIDGVLYRRNSLGNLVVVRGGSVSCETFGEGVDLSGEKWTN